jgi:FkbM family methyltransferase
MILRTKDKIRLARTASIMVGWARRLGNSKDLVEVRRDGLRWQLDLREGIDFSIFLLGVFERSTVNVYRRLIRPGDVVLDIGANIGAHTLQFARLVGGAGRVYAFEPTAFAFTKLARNLELNPELRDRVIAAQVMLTARDDAPLVAEIYSSWPLEKAAGLHHNHLGRAQSTIGCRAMTLDTALAAARVTRVDFVKLDVDGFECEVLQGAVRSLSTFKPTILMELAPHLLPERNRSIHELVLVLAGAGFRLARLNGRPLPMDPEYLLAAVPPGRTLNVLAVASEHNGVGPAGR